MKKQEMKIIKTDSCESLSGKSTLTYQIGFNIDNEIHIALTGNSGAGIFNKDWFAMEQIYSLLASQKKPITSGSLHGLFENRSSNSAGFILAVLLKENFLKISPGNKHYDLVSQAEFQKIVQAHNKKKAGKKGKGVS
jgi:hypothetical protein